MAGRTRERLFEPRLPGAPALTAAGTRAGGRTGVLPGLARERQLQPGKSAPPRNDKCLSAVRHTAGQHAVLGLDAAVRIQPDVDPIAHIPREVRAGPLMPLPLRPPVHVQASLVGER